MNVYTLSTRWRGILLAGAALILLSFLLMRFTLAPGVHREAVEIAGPGYKPCLGVVYTPATPPKAVIVIGHGVSCNTGVMATLAKSFSAQGYLAVAIDFWGHGRSRERFDWNSNASQVLAWCAWARSQYPNLPLAYLGHSMGGMAGGEAFHKAPAVDAFVAMGMIPPNLPSVKMLFALGQYEELFTPDKAREMAAGRADVLVSPYSDHTAEAWDPVLIGGILAWVDKALGVVPSGPVSGLRWCMGLLATLLVGAGAILLATGLVQPLRGAPGTTIAVETDRTWSVNPYRVAGRLFGCQGYGRAPKAESTAHALFLGVVYALAVIVPLSLVLDADIFTSNLNHPARLAGWLVAVLVLLGPALLDAAALERLPLTGAGQRFVLAALTRAVPLFALCIALEAGPRGLAFLGMLLGILGGVSILLALVHALATRSAGDYRAGALASCVILAWICSFWFPLTW